MTDERSKNDQEERRRLNVEELKIQIKSSSESLDDFVYNDVEKVGFAISEVNSWGNHLVFV